MLKILYVYASRCVHSAKEVYIQQGYTSSILKIYRRIFPNKENVTLLALEENLKENNYTS